MRERESKLAEQMPDRLDARVSRVQLPRPLRTDCRPSLPSILCNNHRKAGFQGALTDLLLLPEPVARFLPFAAPAFLDLLELSEVKG